MVARWSLGPRNNRAGIVVVDNDSISVISGTPQY
jgi:hypothetical protein